MLIQGLFWTLPCEQRFLSCRHGLSVTTSFTKLTFVFGGVESHVVTTESYLVFQQENPDNSKLAEKAAELTIGALLDVPPIFNGQTFDAIT